MSKRGAYTDVYALAATLYFLLTNTLPHPAISRASGVVLEEPISINPSISSRVNQAILKGMELEAENRPQSIQEWLELLNKPKYQRWRRKPISLLPKQPIPNPPLSPKFSSDDLSSERNVDYQKLRDLLKSGKWKEADAETLVVMLETSGTKDQGWLDIESIKNFPSTDLRTIDQLWVKYSDEKFGFSVQKRIWENVGGKLNTKNEIALKFSKQVGWYDRKSDDGDKWLPEYELQFTTNASTGHLPSIYKSGLYGSCWRVWADLLLYCGGFSTISLIVTMLVYFIWQWLLGNPSEYLFTVLTFSAITLIASFFLHPIFNFFAWRQTLRNYTILFARPDL